MAPLNFSRARLPFNGGPAAARGKIWIRPFDLLSLTTIFIVYPYVWAGFLRYQFGLKQALAERYAYPALFFYGILVGVMMVEVGREMGGIRGIRDIRWRILKGRIRVQNVIVGFFVILFVLQSVNFVKAAEKFTERTIKEKRYFQDLGRVMEKTNIVIDLPLPTYINQTSLTIKDVVPVMDEKKKIEMVTLDKNFCNEKVKESLKIDEVREFYEEQMRDEFVGKVLSKSRWERCKN